MFPLVYFVRHGQTDWNAEHRLQGQADIELNAVGRAQAERNGQRLAELIANPASFDFVASPLGRTRETMELARAAIGLPRDGYRVDPRLIEVHFGDWQGYTLAELDRINPGSSGARALDKWNFVPPGEGAESYEMLQRRVSSWFDELERPTVCVTHGGIFRVLFKLVGKKPIREAAALDIAQDRVLRLQDRELQWM
jgi:broad specificity phosphatase PhoE